MNPRKQKSEPVAPPPLLLPNLRARVAASVEIATPDLDADATAGDAVRRALAASVARFLRHEAGVWLGEDDEDVHQTRVATRRLRSDLRTFLPLLDPDWVAALRSPLRHLAGHLGAVRDTEVMLSRLRERALGLPEEDRESAARLLERLETTRQEVRARLLGAMREPDYPHLIDRLITAARSPELGPEAAAPARDALPPLLRARWRRLARSVKRLPDPPGARDLHLIRIRAKRCRYAAEAVAPVLGKSARRLAESLAALQDVLGEHQDAIVAQRWLREAAKGAPGDEAFAAGALAARERREVSQARNRWRSCWKRAAKRGKRACRGR